MSLLVADEITKRFAGITALDAVSLEVGEGEAVGLIGPNGAGKTTFFNCLLGVLPPDRGRVTFRGRDVSRIPVYRRARAGIGRTFQRMELFSGMTPREHLLVADRVRRGTGNLLKDVLGRGGPTAEEHRHAQEVLELVGLADVADTPVEALPMGNGRQVELARALVTRPVLLLLDEPSSGLDRYETDAFCEVLATVQAERGTAILLVEHDVEMVQQVASRLYVLDFGQLIAWGPTEDVLRDDDVRRAYLGETV
ncbi:MAG: ABC transporter ATP-binding protein [Acidimicrobiia bacterium]|nr:ABC transporter ATP-binding protein [Acidimicrobiia bacterium]